MAKKGKGRISKVKRNNQTTNKMRKQGKMKLQRHRTKIQKQNQPLQHQIDYSSESEDASGDEFGDMLDEEEQQYLIKQLVKQPNLLSNVPAEEEKNKSRSKKRKREIKQPKPQKPTASDSGASSGSDSDSELEDNYEKQLAERPPKKLRALLPIKTKLGLQERNEEVVDSDSENEEQTKHQAQPDNEVTDSAVSGSDSGMEGTEEDEGEVQGQNEDVISTVQLMAARRDKLNNDKLRIGALCSSLLESPETKLRNFFPLLYLMEEKLKDETLNLHSVRKLATISIFEVFKDILPEYQIRHQDYSNVKLKKDTLALYKHEKELLEHYKRYLQRLEKATNVLRRKRGDHRKHDQATIELGVISVRCMAGLLVARPYFNCGRNIAQSITPLLQYDANGVSDIVAEHLQQVFQNDQRGEITLDVVRLINQLAKKHGERLNPKALDCLLSLKIRDVDLDAEGDIQHKKKQEEKHKKRIVNLSKKEKKRAKKLKEVERELLETEAQESHMARKKLLTEVTKTVFNVYFRLLKTAPRSKLLGATLNGLAKFAHVINLEYYSDLVAILTRLIADDLLPSRSRLLSVRTVLAILAGAGDALNVEPTAIHNHLYQSMLVPHAGSTHEDAKIILESVSKVCARARTVTSAVLQAFAKRITTLSLQTHHNATLACLVLLKQLAQQSKAVDSLVEPDAECGSGKFCAQLGSAAHCHAHGAALHELAALRRHVHGAVRAAAAALLRRDPLPDQLNKLSPVQIFEQYDGSQMAFKPAIPPPRPGPKTKLTPEHSWVQPQLKQYCENLEKSLDLNTIGDALKEFGSKR